MGSHPVGSRAPCHLHILAHSTCSSMSLQPSSYQYTCCSGPVFGRQGGGRAASWYRERHLKWISVAVSDTRSAASSSMGTWMGVRDPTSAVRMVSGCNTAGTPHGEPSRLHGSYVSDRVCGIP